MQAATRFGCRWFLSFDSGSGCRAVAAAQGLKVYPVLTEKDRDFTNLHEFQNETNDLPFAVIRANSCQPRWARPLLNHPPGPLGG